MALDLLLYTGAAIAILFATTFLRSRKRVQFPPGPKPLPFVGNLSEFSKTNDYHHLAKHKDIYGPISSVSILGQRIVILNDRHVAHDLLEKRSGNYSSRPDFVFAKLCGMKYVLPMISYGDTVKAQRKLLHQTLGSKSAISELWPMLETEAHRLFYRIVTEPDNFKQFIRNTAGGIILKIVYGYTIDTKRPDPLIYMADTTVSLIVAAFQPCLWAVDLVPALQYLPDWFPGTRFKQTAKNWDKITQLFTERPLQWVKQQIAKGTASKSIASTPLSEGATEEEEHIIKWAAATAYAGGSETIVIMIQIFYLAMLLRPDVQKKAQAEIDAVIGPNRLPTFTDRDNLPYVNLVVKEVLRWHTPVPLGIPHAALKDDVYNGYLIPKGTMMVMNIWLYNHDPSTHADPLTFNPDRFVETPNHPAEPDPFETLFGFGRRFCPGRLLADSFIYLAVATTLSTLNISRALDEHGNEIIPVYEPTIGGLSHPNPFKCTINPRSKKSKDLIEAVYFQLPPEKSDAESLEAIEVGIDIRGIKLD